MLFAGMEVISRYVDRCCNTTLEVDNNLLNNPSAGRRVFRVGAYYMVGCLPTGMYGKPSLFVQFVSHGS